MYMLFLRIHLYILKWINQPEILDPTFWDRTSKNVGPKDNHKKLGFLSTNVLGLGSNKRTNKTFVIRTPLQVTYYGLYGALRALLGVQYLYKYSTGL